MLISRLAHCFFGFPEFVLSGRNTFIFLKRITGSFSCFRCLIFKVLCALFFSVKRLTILSHFVVFVKNFFQKFFGSFSEKSFSILSHLSMFVKNFFALTFRGTFLSYHNQSRFVKIFFRSVERLTILPRLFSPVNAFFRFFSPFSSVCKICQFFPHFFHFSGTAIFSLSSVYFPLYQQILLAKERCS